MTKPVRLISLAALILPCFLKLVTCAKNHAYKSSNQITANCTPGAQEIVLDSYQKHVLINCQNSPSGWAPGAALEIVVDASVLHKNSLAIYFESVLRFNSDDQIMISDASGTKQQLFEGHPPNGVWLPTDRGSLRIHISKGLNSSASITCKVMPECAAKIGQPYFASPILPNGVNLTGTVQCTFTRDAPSVYEIRNFNLAEGSSLSFDNGVPNEFRGPYTKNRTLNHIIIGQKNTSFTLRYILSESNQTVNFSFYPMSGTACGQDLMFSVKGGQSANVSVSGGSTNKDPVSCYWFVSTTQSGERLRFIADRVSLPRAGDFATVIDSGELNGDPVLQLMALSRNSEAVISSGEYLVVMLTSRNFYDSSQYFGFNIECLSSGGRMQGNGSMTLSGSSEYFLIASNEVSESVYVAFGALVLQGSQKIAVYSDFYHNSEPFIEFDAQTTPFDVTSPYSRLRIIISNFEVGLNGTKIDFFSIQRGSGCIRTFIGAQEADMRVNGKCDATALWIIRPPSSISLDLGASDSDINIFFKVMPNNVDSASIRNLVDNGNSIAINGSSDPFMIGYKLERGALVTLDCRNAGCKNFRMSYIAAATAAQTQVSLTSRRNATITSPFFPEMYPIGGQYHYNVTLLESQRASIKSIANVGSNMNFLASFDVFELLDGQSMSFNSANNTGKVFKGTNIPSDFLLSAVYFEHVVLDAPVFVRENPRGAHGFRMYLMPTAASSNTYTAAAGNFSIGDKSCSSDLPCIYIINVERPNHDFNSSLFLNLTVTASNSTQNASVYSIPLGDLLIWDGESTYRSPLLAPTANLSRGGLFSSHTNQLIIRYTASVKVLFSYVSSPCSFSENTMCLRDRACIPLSWRCDGILQCVDGSDELDCRGGKPLPPPNPPAPSSGSHCWQIWLTIPLFTAIGILLAYAVPWATRWFRESRYQLFHDLGDS